MKILVTGADGFIGSHLAEALAGAGADVTALALYNSFDSFGWLDDCHAPMRKVRGDVRDGAQMMRLCDGKDIVFHLAALIGIPHSYEAPRSYLDTNTGGTLNILEAARERACGRVVVTSTSEVYGTAQCKPIAESHPLVAQSPYAASKIAADKLAESYALSFKTPVTILRPFNTYGPRQSERAVIPTIVRQALDPACESIALGDIDATRDFNFVADTVAAFVACSGSLGPYNVATGIETSIGRVIELVRSIAGTNKPVEYDRSRCRPSDVKALIGDSARFGMETGWKPRVELLDGLGVVVDWWRARMASGLVRKSAAYVC